MKYIQLPELYSKFSHLSNTKWIISKSYLDENDIDSQLCLLKCDSELTARKIVEQTPLGRSLPGNEYNIGSLKVLGRYVLATKSLLENFFASNAVFIAHRKVKPLFYITRNNHLIKLKINEQFSGMDDEENYLDAFWGAKKATGKTENPITTGYFFNHLYGEDFSQILWLESGTYDGEKMVSAYGIQDKEEATTLQKIILQNAAEKGITLTPTNLGIEQNILVVPLKLLTSIYGQIRQVDLCNTYTKHGFEDESAKMRAPCIRTIYMKWDQKKSTSSNHGMNLINTRDTVLKNYSPVFFNPESSSTQENTKITSPTLTN
ncbi:Uncharacterised protein [Legionella busanensis]|uniref:Uncharacterized protein n=1 Tax=Legionella busanensis TaxID=190655 RepID=A0A378JK31_9GAMM|nr:hypothetical protein [Legionella busanensis]STX51585.1 Uncharacterised protein [Legionella busanensis]